MMTVLHDVLELCTPKGAISTVIFLLGVVTLYCIVLTVYRLTLHPLARYPGPILQRISDWPLILHCYSGDRHLIEQVNHERYGSIVRYGPNSLSFSAPAALQEIHSSHANIKKGDWYKTLDISAGAPSTQMVIDATEHALRRRIMSPAFSARALKEAEALIANSAVAMANNIFCTTQSKRGEKDGWSAAVNMGEWATYFGFDFVSDLAYGEPFGMLENDDYRWIPTCLKNASVFLYYAGYLPFAGMVRVIMGTRIQGWIFGKDADDSLKYTNLANGKLANRIDLEKRLKSASIDRRKDTFHYLLNSKDQLSGKRFTVEELQADSALLIAAGSDGVGLTLSATIFYLLRNPNAMSKLQDEIREAFPAATSIANPALGNLPYLSACIDETLRMNPPKASTLPRVVLSGGMTIDNHFIPAGTTVGTPTYVMHHDAASYPDPWTYKPERWIVSEDSDVTNEDVARARAAFSPFLIGPMNCIGKSMSYIALKLALAHLLVRYDVRAAGGSVTGGGNEKGDTGRQREGEYQMKDWILGFRDGPLIELKAR